MRLERVLPARESESPVAGPSAPPAEGEILTEERLRRLERDNLIAALERTEWRVGGENGAAALVGISPSTFKSRMKSLAIVRSARS